MVRLLLGHVAKPASGDGRRTSLSLWWWRAARQQESGVLAKMKNSLKFEISVHDPAIA
jgi:hypothetical protein